MKKCSNNRAQNIINPKKLKRGPKNYVHFPTWQFWWKQESSDMHKHIPKRFLKSAYRSNISLRVFP